MRILSTQAKQRANGFPQWLSVDAYTCLVGVDRLFLVAFIIFSRLDCKIDRHSKLSIAVSPVKLQLRMNTKIIWAHCQTINSAIYFKSVYQSKGRPYGIEYSNMCSNFGPWPWHVHFYSNASANCLAWIWVKCITFNSIVANMNLKLLIIGNWLRIQCLQTQCCELNASIINPFFALRPDIPVTLSAVAVFHYLNKINMYCAWSYKIAMTF